MVQVKKVAMIILMQYDLEAAVEFYKRLGLPLVFYVKGQWAEFSLQGVKIGLCPTPLAVVDHRPGLVFEVADVALLYTQMQEKMTFLGEPTQAAQGTMVSVKDPGGNILDLYQPRPSKTQELYGDVAQPAQDGCCQPEKVVTCCKAG